MKFDFCSVQGPGLLLVKNIGGKIMLSEEEHNKDSRVVRNRPRRNVPVKCP